MGLFFILRKIKCDLNDDDFISSFLIINFPKSVQYNKVFFPSNVLRAECIKICILIASRERNRIFFFSSQNNIKLEI